MSVETQKSEKRENMEKLKRKLNQMEVNDIKCHGKIRGKEAENKALNFIQRKKYKYLRTNYVLSAFTCMKYFKKKEFSSVLGCGFAG